MENFKKQIEEDIGEIQEQYIMFDDKLQSSPYAFNFWILQKIYSIDEDIIPNLILDDSDRGIDCYVFNEDRKELYLIQNKFYGENTSIDIRTITDEYLSRPLEHLNSGIYKHSRELQEIFTKYKNDEEFKIFLHYYVTRNSSTFGSIKGIFEKYCYKNINCLVMAEFFDLDDIEIKYFEDRNKYKKNFETDLFTITKYTRVDITPGNIIDSDLIRSQFMPVSIMSFYDLIKKANDEKYPLFEENIRDFIGENSVINADIINTLKDPNERKNFIYYNNGITIIADEIEVERRERVNDTTDSLYTANTNKTHIKNPQIVNGCQTVNAIYYVLKTYRDRTDMERDFAKVYVMVKLLQLSNKSEKEKGTYLKIVQYNNSQNAIKIKDFAAAQNIFTNLHQDLKDYGFFLLTKQSHQNEFRGLDKSIKSKMLHDAKKLCESVDIEIKNADLKIDLIKLLQTLLAYYDVDGGYTAYIKKSETLKINSKVYDFVIDKIKSITKKQLLSIYLNYLKAEKDRKSGNKTDPVPYYLLTMLNKIQNGIIKTFDDSGFVSDYNIAEKATKTYMVGMLKIEPQYNKLIKQRMNAGEINKAIEIAKIYC